MNGIFVIGLTGSAKHILLFHFLNSSSEQHIVFTEISTLLEIELWNSKAKKQVRLHLELLFLPISLHMDDSNLVDD